MPDRQHGVSEPRGLSNTLRSRSYDGRFGRLFQDLADKPAQDPMSEADQGLLREIAEAMRESDGPGEDNPRVPAGYVYLGQFVDHDLTFDPTSQLQRRNDVAGLLNFRTPRFDLDSVYGSGPDDEPFQYDRTKHDGFALLVEDRGPGPDMPRNRDQQRALIGDPRNDENGIVSQLHVAFLLLHNRLLDVEVGRAGTLRDAFNEAQRRAQWHYQWVVVHDFLRRTIGDDLHGKLLVTTEEPDGKPRESVRLRHYRHKANPYLPVEFSAAAYRFGIAKSGTSTTSTTRSADDSSRRPATTSAAFRPCVPAGTRRGPSSLSLTRPGPSSAAKLIWDWPPHSGSFKVLPATMPTSRSATCGVVPPSGCRPARTLPPR